MDKASVDKVAENAWDLAHEPGTDFESCVLLKDCLFTIKELQSRIADLEKDLVKEAARTAAQKLRADQLDKQHSMQAKMHAEAASKVAELEKDAARLDWMQENYICADFRYGEPATEVIVIEIPRGARVCGDLRVDIDTAMQKD